VFLLLLSFLPRGGNLYPLLYLCNNAVLGAIFLSEFGRDSHLAQWIDFFNNVLSGVPSIVIGVFVYGAIVLSTGTYSAVAGGIALAILMLPIILRTAVESLEAVPQEIRQAAMGLGASEFQTVTRIILPAALPAIVTGVLLAIARAAGETAPLLFTALFSQYWIRGIWEPTPTLSVLVFNYATSPYRNQQELAWVTAFVLVALVLLTSILSRWMIRRHNPISY
jgi:phosphate transport system permease protein